MTMLTVTQSTSRGLTSVHDLPTPPSTSRLSPPPVSHARLSYRQSPDPQSMSHPHRGGLPPPAAMGIPSQQHGSTAPPQTQPSAPPPHQHQGSMPAQASLPPPPPPHWSGGEEAMKTWLAARTEEERTRQESEKTRQEELRLEQRKVEREILRSSLSGGIPPPLIPLVFAGMGSGAANAQISNPMLEWAQAYATQQHQQQLLPSSAAQPHRMPEHPREVYAASQPPMAGPAGQTVYGGHPASPSRQRGQTISGPVSRGPPGAPGQSAQAYHAVGQASQPQQEGGIFFHHWHPPGAPASSGSTNAPGTPSADVPKKRKAPGVQPQSQPHQDSGPSSSGVRLSSPPVFQHSNTAPPGVGGPGHKRQRSDIPWTQPISRDVVGQRPRRKSFSPAGDYATDPGRTTVKAEAGMHSVSAMLSSASAEPDSMYPSARVVTTPRQTREEGQISDPSGGRYHREVPGMRRGSPRPDSRNTSRRPGEG